VLLTDALSTQPLMRARPLGVVVSPTGVVTRCKITPVAASTT
jgi:hypothetical protein